MKSPGTIAEAKPLYEEALSIRRRVLGVDHPDLADSLNNLAGCIMHKGGMRRPSRCMMRRCRLPVACWGRIILNTATSLNNLAGLYRGSRAVFVEAARLLMEAVEIMVRVLGVEHPNTKLCEKNYEVLLAKMQEKGAE